MLKIYNREFRSHSVSNLSIYVDWSECNDINFICIIPEKHIGQNNAEEILITAAEMFDEMKSSINNMNATYVSILWQADIYFKPRNKKEKELSFHDFPVSMVFNKRSKADFPDYSKRLRSDSSDYYVRKCFNLHKGLNDFMDLANEDIKESAIPEKLKTKRVIALARAASMKVLDALKCHPTHIDSESLDYLLTHTYKPIILAILDKFKDQLSKKQIIDGINSSPLHEVEPGHIVNVSYIQDKYREILMERNSYDTLSKIGHMLNSIRNRAGI